MKVKSLISKLVMTGLCVLAITNCGKNNDNNQNNNGTSAYYGSCPTAGQVYTSQGCLYQNGCPANYGCPNNQNCSGNTALCIPATYGTGYNQTCPSGQIWNGNQCIVSGGGTGTQSCYPGTQGCSPQGYCYAGWVSDPYHPGYCAYQSGGYYQSGTTKCWWNGWMCVYY